MTDAVHELTNTLTAIRVDAELALMVVHSDSAGADAIRERLRGILDAVDRSAAFVRERLNGRREELLRQRCC